MDKIKREDILSILIVLFIIFTVLLIIEIFNIFYYKIDVGSISKKSILYYKSEGVSDTNGVSKFMKLVSDEKYEEAFDMLDANNRVTMFNNNLADFSKKMSVFSNSYTNIKYNTILSRESENYIDEEVICTLDTEEKLNNNVRVNVRQYKDNKKARLIILNMN